MKSLYVHRASKLFQPLISSPVKPTSTSKISSRSQKLLISAGIIHQAHNGLFHLLPLGIRVLKKLTALIEHTMEYNLNAQRISVPALTSGELWTKTERMDLAGAELFKVVDRHGKEFVLAPTHEESVANLIATVPLISHRNLPLLLYQITSKYRDEMRPRFGLIRSKEFLMKDLYSFDKDEESATQSYSKICGAYESIFNKIGVKFIKVAGETGFMGGSYSHEFHFPAEIGDDTLLICDSCQSGSNKNLYNDEVNKSDTCLNCGSSSLREHKGIEVGHTFLLGTKYSAVLQAQYNSNSQKRCDLVMGSYGLGLTRMLGAAVEMLSTENEIRWPSSIAPYSAVIITPKKGSKEELVSNKALEFYEALQSVDTLKDDMILDDRDHLSIGRRLNDALITGYPRIIVVGKSALHESPTFELHYPYEGLKLELPFQEIVDVLRDERCDRFSVKQSVRDCSL